MVQARTKKYTLANQGILPKNILFYRDGISESQYAECERKEIPAIRQAWLAVWEDLSKTVRSFDASKQPAKEPNVTFIIVAKRHNTRFFPVAWNSTVAGFNPVTADDLKKEKTFPKQRSFNEKKAMDANTNIKPGLLVQHDIVMPHYTNFYLQSHDAIKGTARSAHYVVLENGCKFTDKQLHDTVSLQAPLTSICMY